MQALESLSEVASFHAAVVALAGDDGPVVVARRGKEEPDDHRSIIPLSVGSRDVGMVVVISAREPTQAEYQATAESLQPVALAFSNILLLQDIARRAIREERARLARDLHDDIGPSLASLGLALDLALLQHPADPDLAEHLRELRTSVGGMVEDVRSTVADLRMPEQPSVTEVMKSLSASVARGRSGDRRSYHRTQAAATIDCCGRHRHRHRSGSQRCPAFRKQDHHGPRDR